jgi:hypothetical protein
MFVVSLVKLTTTQLASFLVFKTLIGVAFYVIFTVRPTGKNDIIRLQLCQVYTF